MHKKKMMKCLASTKEADTFVTQYIKELHKVTDTLLDNGHTDSMEVIKLQVVKSTRYSITLSWTKINLKVEPSYKLQMKERINGWTTKYWGYRTQIEITNLGPEQCYHFRVGIVNDPTKKDTIWSDVFPAATKDNLMATTNLHRAVQCGNINGLRKFLNNRPNAVDAYDSSGQSALMKASKVGDIQLVSMLVSNGAIVEHPGKAAGRTALMLAASQGHVEVAQLLLEKGADWHTKDGNGCSALHYAVDSSQLDIVKLATSTSNTDTEIRDSKGWTPLMRGIIMESSNEVLNELISNGASVNAVDKHKQTCLMQAVLTGQLRLANLLLISGADYSLKNVYGHTAFQMATSLNHKDIVNSIMEAKNKNETERTKVAASKEETVDETMNKA